MITSIFMMNISYCDIGKRAKTRLVIILQCVFLSFCELIVEVERSVTLISAAVVFSIQHPREIKVWT